LLLEDTRPPDASQTLRIWGISESITSITAIGTVDYLGYHPQRSCPAVQRGWRER
jgi:hypothetical protein